MALQAVHFFIIELIFFVLSCKYDIREAEPSISCKVSGSVPFATRDNNGRLSSVLWPRRRRSNVSQKKLKDHKKGVLNFHETLGGSGGRINKENDKLFCLALKGDEKPHPRARFWSMDSSHQCFLAEQGGIK